MFTRRYAPALILVTLSISVAVGPSWMVPCAQAQGITTGTISGVVMDPSGAAVPNAQIMATSNNQGTQRQVVAGPSGEFSLHAVPIGQYTLTVSASGFTAISVTNVEVNSGATTDVKSIQLKLGANTQQVEVNGSSEVLLQTSDSQVTTTFSSQTIQNIPLNNGFDTAAELIPGVASTHGDGFSNTNGDNYSVNGQSGRYNNSEIDGQANNDNSIGGPQFFFANQDAVQELQVVTNNFSAQYGRNAGAVINYITKNGTNVLHGSGFEFYQGQQLSSFANPQKNPLFGFCAPGQSPSTGCAVPSLPRYVENRYGGTLGGPILKDKLFFFGSTYWDRVRQGAAAVSSLPGLTPDPVGLQTLQSAFPGNPAVTALVTSGPYGVKAGNPIPTNITMETVTGPGGVFPRSSTTRNISAVWTISRPVAITSSFGISIKISLSRGLEAAKQARLQTELSSTVPGARTPLVRIGRIALTTIGWTSFAIAFSRESRTSRADRIPRAQPPASLHARPNSCSSVRATIWDTARTRYSRRAAP